jgi:predicted ATPase/class 3 adenylate cyclase
VRGEPARQQGNRQHSSRSVARVNHTTNVVTFLFTDLEGSTRLWEQDAERMRGALAQHDELLRTEVEAHGGRVVKRTGDGIHAAFDDPTDALAAALALQRRLADPGTTAGVALRARCGIHAGAIEQRDDDYFGAAVNRAARITSAAHGGQTLVSQAVADLVGDRLPDGIALRDLGTVRLRDLSGPMRVFQLVHPALRADFPALRSLEATPNNLPPQLTTFVGRERELAEARELLSRHRMLTLCGMGGLGKSRLSLQLAGAVLGEYPDGAWFVDLAGISDPGLVPQAIATTLGVREDAGGTAADALMRFVQDRALLLILDNCEHLVDACARVAADLLRASPGVRIVATSRENLRVPGEAAYPVPALAVPAAGEETDIGSIARREAVLLFLDRAAAAQPGFRLTERNASQIGEICRRLDGMPLAIELVAARLRALSIDAIAARIGDALRLLSGGARTLLPRQQTLRALVDWSHDLLTEPEKALFRRLSACAGGWSVEAAEAVGAGDPIAREDVIDLLASLVDKSLVAFDAESGRYRQLDTIRPYAAEKLRAADEEDATCRRHLEHFLALAEAMRPVLASPSGAGALARLDRDRENLLAAHATCARPGLPAELGYRLVHALKPYWVNRALDFGRRLAIDAVARGDKDAPTAARAFALFDAGQLSAYMGRYAEAQPYLRDCLAIARERGESALAAATLQFLALAALGEGDRAQARQHSRDGLALARTLGNALEIAGACTALAQLCRLDGKHAEAAPLLEEALDLSRREGNVEYETTALLNLAMFEVERGGADSARRHVAEGLAKAEEAGSRHLVLTALEASVGLAVLMGAWERAARLFGVAEAQADAMGIQRDPVDESFLRRSVGAVREALGAQAFETLENAGRAEAFEVAVRETAGWLGGAA